VRLDGIEPRTEPVRAGVRAGPLRSARRELPTRRGLLVGRRGRTAFTGNLGRDALRYLAHRPAVAQEVGAALDVDESGRDDEAADIEPLPGRKPAERPRRANTRDAVAADGDVAEEPCGPRAVDDATVLEHEIERRLRLRRRRRTAATRDGERENAEQKETASHVRDRGETEKTGIAQARLTDGDPNGRIEHPARRRRGRFHPRET